MGHIKISGVATAQTMPVWWIGDTGTSIPIESSEALKSPLYPFNAEAPDTAFRGFRWIRMGYAPDRIEVSFSRYFATQEAIAATARRLRTASPLPVRLFYDEADTGLPDWTIEDLPDPTTAAKRLNNVAVTSKAYQLSKTAILQRSLDKIGEQPRLLQKALALWREDLSGRALREHVAAKAVEASSRDGQLWIDRVGPQSDCAAAFGESWAAKAAGRRWLGASSSADDNDYDGRTASSYDRVTNQQSPMRDEVHAVWTRDDGIRQRATYARLLLPLLAENGSHSVISISKYLNFGLPILDHQPS